MAGMGRVAARGVQAIGQRAAAGAQTLKDRAAASVREGASVPAGAGPAGKGGTPGAAAGAGAGHGPSHAGEMPASAADQQPAWAKRLKRQQRVTHAATTLAHTLRGGDSGASGNGPTLRDSDS
ncbi:TPA: hypothetical protein UOJ00_003883 [Stenotrophomonas maltophilia]|nr:hypothetical protein [Stenotrophomonas maltophilia]